MRTVAPAAVTALGQPVVPLAQLVFMNTTVPLRLNTSAWDLVWSGNTYLAGGRLGNVEQVDDSPGELKGLRFSMSGVPSEAIALALTEPVQGKAVWLGAAIFDPATYQILDVSIDWEGRLDVMNILESGDTCTLQVTAEHIGIDLLRPSNVRYSHADQQLIFPGDRGFEYVIDQSDQAIVWPSRDFYRV